MVAHKNERQVFLLKLQPFASPIRSGKEVSFDEVIQILELAHSNDTARCELTDNGRFPTDESAGAKDEKNQIYIADIERSKDGKAITFLFNRGDPTAAFPAFLATATNAVEVVEPKDDQTQGYSAHLIISLQSDADGHRACLEKMQNVSSSLVFSAINRLLARGAKNNRKKYTYEVTDDDGNKKLKDYKPKILIKRVASEKLEKDLEQGKLTGITLTRKIAQYAGVGAKEIIRSQTEKIHFGTKPAAASSVISMVQGLAAWGKKQGYQNITFELNDLPGQQSNNPTLSLAQADALEELYCRAKIVDGLEDTPTCHEAIHGDIQRKVTAVLRDNSLWSKPK